MLFNTVQYLLFLLLAAIAYYCLPAKVRYVWLLLVSYFFYMQWNALYIVLLFSCTLLTYLCGRAVGCLREREKEGEACRKLQRTCFAACILLNLGILGFFKYFNFGIACLNHILRAVHISEIGWEHDILLPVGISFYTLQALGYLIDVYRGDIYVEKNFLRYALFVSFFPQLVAGPIERSKNLLVQLNTQHSFCYENLRKGMLLVLYGLFLKMVIADRAAVLVDTVYGNTAEYSGFYIVVATVFFSVQIYCDFYGYSTVARGSALIMGIYLTDNFKAPYYAKSVKEFWRRWHISLSDWFRDYLYIPLGGNRKGRVRKSRNLLMVFAISGLWHGASIAFILWGLLNGLYQMADDAAAAIQKWLQKKTKEKDTDRRFSRTLFQTMVTYGLVTFAWLFFRAGGFENAVEILRHLIGNNNWTILFDGSLYGLGIPRNYMNILLVSILVLFIVDYHKYQDKDVAELFLKQGWCFRVTVIMLLLFAILLYGCYGEMYDTQQFIYFQF